jgi:hypothetical protein
VVAIHTGGVDIALRRRQGVRAQVRVGGDVRRLVFDGSEFGALGNAWLQSTDAGLAMDRYEIHVGARSEGVTIGESHEESRGEVRASLSTHPSGVWP